MNTSQFVAASIAALATLGAAAATAADNTPFAGEQPFAHEAASYSFNSRAAVQAQGVRAINAIATGENNLAAPVGAPRLSRAQVVAELRDAQANGTISFGDADVKRRPVQPGTSTLSRAEVRADARQAMHNGQFPATGELN